METRPTATKSASKSKLAAAAMLSSVLAIGGSPPVPRLPKFPKARRRRGAGLECTSSSFFDAVPNQPR